MDMKRVINVTEDSLVYLGTGKEGCPVTVSVSGKLCGASIMGASPNMAQVEFIPGQQYTFQTNEDMYLLVGCTSCDTNIVVTICEAVYHEECPMPTADVESFTGCYTLETNAKALCSTSQINCGPCSQGMVQFTPMTYDVMGQVTHTLLELLTRSSLMDSFNNPAGCHIPTPSVGHHHHAHAPSVGHHHFHPHTPEPCGQDGMQLYSTVSTLCNDMLMAKECCKNNTAAIAELNVKAEAFGIKINANSDTIRGNSESIATGAQQIADIFITLEEGAAAIEDIHTNIIKLWDANTIALETIPNIQGIIGNGSDEDPYRLNIVSGPHFLGAGTTANPLLLNLITDETLSGLGTAASPAKVTLAMSENFAGTGLPSDPVRLVVPFTNNFTGVGTAAAPIGLHVFVNPEYFVGIGTEADPIDLAPGVLSAFADMNAKIEANRVAIEALASQHGIDVADVFGVDLFDALDPS